MKTGRVSKAPPADLKIFLRDLRNWGGRMRSPPSRKSELSSFRINIFQIPWNLVWIRRGGSDSREIFGFRQLWGKWGRFFGPHAMKTVTNWSRSAQIRFLVEMSARFHCKTDRKCTDITSKLVSVFLNAFPRPFRPIYFQLTVIIAALKWGSE